MADEGKDKTKESTTENPKTGAPKAVAGAQPQPQRQPLQLDDSSAIACYANICRVTGTPEELIIDFGLNPQPWGVPTEAVHIKQRIITNFYTAKRLLHALQLTVQRHEATFGVLETDVQKRILPSVRQAQQQAQQQQQQAPR